MLIKFCRRKKVSETALISVLDDKADLYIVYDSKPEAPPPEPVPIVTPVVQKPAPPSVEEKPLPSVTDQLHLYVFSETHVLFFINYRHLHLLLLPHLLISPSLRAFISRS